MSKYRIRAVEKITNIPADTIRNWERRYDFLKPVQGPGGEKLYSEHDVEVLRKITVLLKSGGRISEIAAKIFDQDFLQAVGVEDRKVSNEIQLMIEEYYNCLLSLSLQKIDQFEDLVDITINFKNRLDLVYYPLLARVRKDCAIGHVKKVQEFFVTSHILSKMKAFLSSAIFRHDTLKPTLICASPSSAIFEGGLLTLACSMKLRGYNILYLGANLPIIELKGSAEKVAPAVLAFAIHDPEELAAIVKVYGTAEYPVVVGGIGVRLSESLEASLGAVRLITYSGLEAVDKLEAICVQYTQTRISR